MSGNRDTAIISPHHQHEVDNHESAVGRYTHLHHLPFATTQTDTTVLHPVLSLEPEGGQIHLNVVLYPVLSLEPEGGQIHLNVVLYPVLSLEPEGGQIHLNVVKAFDLHNLKLTQRGFVGAEIFHS